MNKAISFDGIHFEYKAKPVISDLHLVVDSGHTLALLGPSGCGKTTVLRLLLGLAVPERGSVLLEKKVVSKDGRLLVPPEERGLAVVFQDLALWPHLSVHGNLQFGLAANGVSHKERESRSVAILRRLGLEDKASRYPGELSGGERQRVAIARALVLEPQAILLDEPLSNLDVALKRELLSLFRTLFEEYKSTVIYVTHDPREAVALSDRIAVMESGRIVQIGTRDEMREISTGSFMKQLFDYY